MSLKGLAEQVNPVKAVDVFDDTKGIDQDLVKKYYEVNERKKADEKWLKDNKPKIEKALSALNRDKVDVGELRVSVTVPDTSHFDEEKIVAYFTEVLSDEDFSRVVKLIPKIDEEALQELVEEGKFSLDELKTEAWVESKGTPRLVIKEVKSSE